jgi:hypothetical protein
MLEEALEIATDADYKFDLAVQLGKLEIAKVHNNILSLVFLSDYTGAAWCTQLPACAGSDHFGSYVRNIFLHFCRRLFLGIELMISWSQGNNFAAAPGLPFIQTI